METAEYPEAIETLQNVIIGLNEYIANLKDEQQAQEDKFFFVILNTINEAGKPLYTNEASREAALRNMRRESIGWRKLTNDIRKVKSEVAENEAKLERLRSEFRIALIDKVRTKDLFLMEIAA